MSIEMPEVPAPSDAFDHAAQTGDPAGGYDRDAKWEAPFEAEELGFSE